MMAKEGITFEKYPALRELEAQHNVDIGLAYITDILDQKSLLWVEGNLILVGSGIDGTMKNNVYPYLDTSKYSKITQSFL